MAGTVGELVRMYRVRQRQIHNGQPWAQEDLATAIGSDKSHINRIERGHQQPTLQTLRRIAEALQLTWEDRAQLFRTAGYLVEQPPPDPGEVDEVVSRSQSLLQTVRYPACLLDEEHRQWDVNDLLAYAFLGYPSREACLREIRGRSTIELLFDHRVGEWWSQVLVEYDRYVHRQVIRFWRVYLRHQHNPWYQNLCERLLRQPRFRALWDQLLSRAPLDEHFPLFLDQQSVTVDHPRIGRYTVEIWKTRLTWDDRFVVSHHLPANPATHRLFERLTESPRQCRAADPRTSRAHAPAIR